jgi:hypothetical protein
MKYLAGVVALVLVGCTANPRNRIGLGHYHILGVGIISVTSTNLATETRIRGVGLYGVEAVRINPPGH